jgi:hypothetical protein
MSVHISHCSAGPSRTLDTADADFCSKSLVIYVNELHKHAKYFILNTVSTPLPATFLEEPEDLFILCQHNGQHVAHISKYNIDSDDT